MTAKRKGKAKRKSYRRVGKSTRRKSPSNEIDNLLATLGLIVGGAALASLISKRVPTKEVSPGLYELKYKPSQHIVRAIDEAI